MEWIMLLYMNGYVVPYGVFKTAAACNSHLTTVMNAFKQAESKAYVRCEPKIQR